VSTLAAELLKVRCIRHRPVYRRTYVSANHLTINIPRRVGLMKNNHDAAARSSPPAGIDTS